MISVVITSETAGLVPIPEEDVVTMLEAGEVIDGVLMMTTVDEAASVEEVTSTNEDEAEDSGTETGVVSVAVTGQVVVETGMITVVRTVE